MTYVDIAIAIGFFLFFIALVLGLSVQYFARTPSETNVEEYRQIAVDMMTRFFSTGGTPSDWEDSSELPSELGLVDTIRKIQVSVEEPGTNSRTDEPVVLRIYFDEECINKSRNDTVRVYNSTLYEHNYELVNPVFCSGQLLNESYIRFKVNISQSEKKNFYIYFSEDTDIPGPSYTLSYSTSAWQPNSGDSWTEATTDWNRFGGSSASAATSTSRMRGSYSVQIQDTFDSEKLGLKYDPISSITGVSNGWYIDSWIYVDDLTGVSSVNVSVSDGTDEIVSSIGSGSMESGVWYHLERELSASNWESWGTFDASNGMDNVTFYMVNSTAGITRQLRLDETHFELKPLVLRTFPEETESIISSKKISALNNLTYNQLRDVTGENYRFRVEIIE